MKGDMGSIVEGVTWTVGIAGRVGGTRTRTLGRRRGVILLRHVGVPIRAEVLFVEPGKLAKTNPIGGRPMSRVVVGFLLVTPVLLLEAGEESGEGAVRRTI